MTGADRVRPWDAAAATAKAISKASQRAPSWLMRSSLLMPQPRSIKVSVLASLSAISCGRASRSGERRGRRKAVAELGVSSAAQRTIARRPIAADHQKVRCMSHEIEEYSGRDRRGGRRGSEQHEPSSRASQCLPRLAPTGPSAT
eukprot:6172538-Pleurochrysis_carterae.AAC.4